jgi:flagellar FliJ protein
MSWTASLIRIREFEIETLRKRLKAVQDRRAAGEAALVALDAEIAREVSHATAHAEAGWYLVGFREGARARRLKIEGEIKACTVEEAGARDALQEGFEALKKVEQVAEGMAIAARKEENRREIAALDEIALRPRSAA